MNRGAHGATVFKEPSGSPDERYKLVHMGREAGQPGLLGAVSPDGLRWRPLEKPLLTGFYCDTQTVMHFDTQRGRHVGYFRGWTELEGERWHGRRTIAYAESESFETWPIPQTIAAADIFDGPSTDIYTNSCTPWPAAADAHRMFPAFYQRASDLIAIHLMTSRDGRQWLRPLRQAVFSTDELGVDWRGGAYAGCGLVALRPDEWSLPIAPKGCSHNAGYFAAGWPPTPPHRGYLCRAVWRPDGLMSVEAETEGQFTTMPLIFSGARLEITARTRFGGEIRFELVEALGHGAFTAGAAIPGYTCADCDPIIGDAPRHVVGWRGQTDLSAWAGKPMRIRVWLRRARLHVIQFVV